MFLAPAVPNFPPPPIHPRPSYKVPYILPSSVRPKSFICHSYENCRGGGGSSKNLFKKNFRSLPSFPASGAAPCGDSGLFHESPVTSHQSLSPLECALPRLRALSPLQCAVTRFHSLSALECAVPKTRPCKSFRMRSSEKKWGEGCSSAFPISIFEFRRSRPLFRFAVILRLDVEPAFGLLGHQV